MKMSLAQQGNLFGEPQSIAVAPKTKATASKAPAQRNVLLSNPALRDMAAAVYTDYGYEASPEDSEYWLALFEMADGVNAELCAILMYLRGGGAKLLPHPKWGYVIRPIVGRGAWPTAETYDAERQALLPYREQLLKLLKGLNDTMKKRR